MKLYEGAWLVPSDVAIDRYEWRSKREYIVIDIGYGLSGIFADDGDFLRCR